MTITVDPAHDAPNDPPTPTAPGAERAEPDTATGTENRHTDAATGTDDAGPDAATGTDTRRTGERSGTRRTIRRTRRSAPGAHRPGVGGGLLRDDSGMSTVEYAIGTVAAAAFAAILYAVVSGDTIVGALTGIVQRALSTTF